MDRLIGRNLSPEEEGADGNRDGVVGYRPSVGGRLGKEVLRRWSGPLELGSDTGDPTEVKGTIYFRWSRPSVDAPEGPSSSGELEKGVWMGHSTNRGVEGWRNGTERKKG